MNPLENLARIPWLCPGPLSERVTGVHDPQPRESAQSDGMDTAPSTLTHFPTGHRDLGSAHPEAWCLFLGTPDSLQTCSPLHETSMTSLHLAGRETEAERGEDPAHPSALPQWVSNRWEALPSLSDSVPTPPFTLALQEPQECVGLGGFRRKGPPLCVTHHLFSACQSGERGPLPGTAAHLPSPPRPPAPWPLDAAAESGKSHAQPVVRPLGFDTGCWRRICGLFSGVNEPTPASLRLCSHKGSAHRKEPGERGPGKLRRWEHRPTLSTLRTLQVGGEGLQEPRLGGPGGTVGTESPGFSPKVTVIESLGRPPPPYHCPSKFRVVQKARDPTRAGAGRKPQGSFKPRTTQCPIHLRRGNRVRGHGGLGSDQLCPFPLGDGHPFQSLWVSATSPVKSDGGWQ